jgi:4-hydroxybenzoate polyprenyltransferase
MRNPSIYGFHASTSSVALRDPLPSAIAGQLRFALHVGNALRPHHWTKNLLLFSAVLLSSHPYDAILLSQAALAFVAFSLCASAAYLVNDVVDIDVDRLHPVKRNRPFAAGALPAACGLPLAAIALGLGIMAGAALPVSFLVCLLLYVVATTIYSTWLKKLFLVDVATLALLYTLRLVAGGYATGTPVSKWLVAACMLLFLSLALGKRCSELRRLATENKCSPDGRGYVVDDLAPLATIGLTCGLLAGLALIAYVNSGTVLGLYQLETALWLFGPIYFYWIARFWRKTNQGEPLEDPVVFVLRDPVSIALGCGLLIWLQVPAIA